MKYLQMVISISGVLLLFLMVLAVLLPVSPANMPLASRNSGVFLYTGWRLTQGDIPYRDVWDHKPPLIFFINAFGLLLSNNSRWGIWFLEFVSLFTAAILGFIIFRKAFNNLTAYITSFLWLSAMVFMLEGGNYTTEYTIPLQFACLLLAWIAERRRSYGWYGFLIGILTGFAFFTKQNTIGISVSILLYLASTRAFAGKWKELIREIGIIFAGFSIVAIVLIIFFAINKSIAELWDESFLYNIYYISESSLFSRLQSVYRGALLLFRTNLGFMGFAGWGIAISTFIISRKNIKPEFLPLLIIAMIALPVEFAMASLGGRLINHYFMTFLPIFAFFSAFFIFLFFEGLKSWLHHPSERIMSRVSIVAILLIFPLINFKYIKDYIDVYLSYRVDSDKTLQVIEYLENNSSSEDTLLMLKAETYVNFATKRIAPDRYIYQYPLETPGYATPEMVEMFLRDVIRRKPAFIADKVGEFLQTKNYPVQDSELEMLISEIRRIYKVNQVIGNWTIYEYMGK